MSKSEQAMLRIAFWGVMFLTVRMQPIVISHPGWVDKIFAVTSGAMMVGYSVRYLWFTVSRSSREEVEIIDTWNNKKP